MRNKGIILFAAIFFMLSLATGCLQASESSPMRKAPSQSAGQPEAPASEPLPSENEDSETEELPITQNHDADPVVYMTTDISPGGLMAVYEALNWSPTGSVAVKLSTGEAGKSISDHLGNGERIVYINVMNHLSVDCDCDGSPAAPDMHDVGILASTDPVALDQACVDLVYAAVDGQSLINRIESRNGIHTLEHAETIGLGSRTYELVTLNA